MDLGKLMMINLFQIKIDWSNVIYYLGIQGREERKG